ncbi:alpha/beta hydrolase [uncultured Gulosibacter sp.]|uniref:alpha/beta hydrolase n=1 Tax=uncultured Gulosibacter sp. TaxID=1339167 RepID=UPI0028895EFB|nr:alpha/beta hydrolase [uncultured Gulosibacter sp.]
MVSWQDILGWHPSALDTTVGDLNERGNGLRDAADDLDDARNALQSRGETVSAAQKATAKSSDDTNLSVSLLSELSMATAQAASGVADVETRVHECQSFESIKELVIHSSGSVSIAPSRQQRIDEYLRSNFQAGMQQQFEANADREQLSGDVTDSVRRAREVDDAYHDRLAAVERGDVKAEGADAFAQGLPDLPQPGWSDREVAAWWNSLSLEEQQQIIEHHPEAIGNLDGIDGRSRDKANMNRLPGLIEDAEKQLAEAEKQWRMDPESPLTYKAYLDAKERLDDLNTIRDTRAAGGQLLLLDASGSEGVRAAIATGDIDSAKYVATLVPGMNTTVRDSLPGMVSDMTRLRNITSIEQGIDSSDIAMVSWIGYDAPQNPVEVASTGRATDGAGNLNRFVEGVHASRAYGEHGDPRMTVFGHSYGSTTAGMGMRDVNVGVVDDLVMFGSPGSGVQDAREYNVAGQAYVSAVDSHDWVQGMGPDGSFGKNPTKVDGIEHLSGDDGIRNHRSLDPFSRHSTYLKTPEGQDSTGILSDFAAVIAGNK